MTDIIDKKRKGVALSDDEIRYFISSYTSGGVPDFQASALAMAICFNGMTEREVITLTDAMMRSGDTVDLSAFGNMSVDKHSTGGVGDKTTLILVPIAASLGCVVAKMSGRGLGHTGGTVDKLESFPGYVTSMTPEEFLGTVKKTGIAVIGQSARLAPADKKLYSLRDASATVESIPLIASSIMSKKLASGAHNIVLDVKSGSGAFMKNEHDACALAETMVGIGKGCGRNVRALVTNMDAPLGENVGNILEVKEAIGVLKGEVRGELREICVAIAANMASLAKNTDISEEIRAADDAIDSGKALLKMKEWISAQGGDASYIEDVSKFPEAKIKREIISDKEGYIFSMDTELIGNASSLLGAGRFVKDGEIDLTAGIVIKKKTGDYVRRGEVIATLYTSDDEKLAQGEKLYLSSLSFSENMPEKKPLIYKTVL